VSGDRIACCWAMERWPTAIDGAAGGLRMMRAVGVRYLTLTHKQRNVPWADAADRRTLCCTDVGVR